MAWITTPQRTTYDWHEVPADEVPTDREMKAVVVMRLNENLYTQDCDIRVEVADRVIALHGDVVAGRREARRRRRRLDRAGCRAGGGPPRGRGLTGRRQFPSAVGVGVHPHDRAVADGTHLHEVADLVGDPQPAASDLVGRRPATSDQRIGELAAVADPHTRPPSTAHAWRVPPPPP